VNILMQEYVIIWFLLHVRQKKVTCNQNLLIEYPNNQWRWNRNRTRRHSSTIEEGHLKPSNHHLVPLGFIGDTVRYLTLNALTQGVLYLTIDIFGTITLDCNGEFQRPIFSVIEELYCHSIEKCMIDPTTPSIFMSDLKRKRKTLQFRTHRKNVSYENQVTFCYGYLPL
jgi:hypothetical protein